MTKQFLLAFLFLICSSAFSFAADLTLINGRTTDADQKPLEFVVVTLLKAEDSTLAKGAISGADGSFAFENIPAGKYFVSASLTGYTKKWTDVFEVSSGQMQVPDITLEANKEMQEVVIVSTQPLLVQKAGMIVMNVENSPVRIIGTAFDLIGKAPGVVIDQNGNITLKGKAGVNVYVDGKNTYLNGEQLKNYLQNIPAQNVVRIEIITNPSAKYDAQGNAGIINIITQKGSRQGLNGSVYSNVGSGELFRTGEGFSFNYGKPKYNIYGKYDFNSGGRLERHHIDKSVPYEGRTTYFRQSTLMYLRPLSHNARIGIDFTPNEKTTWGIQVNGMRDAANIDTDNYSEIIQPDSGMQKLNQVNHLRGRFSNGGAGAFFRHQLDSNGTEISASADYLLYYDRTKETYDLQFRDNAGNPLGDLLRQRSRSGSDINIYVGQADFSHPFGKIYKIESGLKGSYVENSSSIAFEIENNSLWENDPTRTNLFVYKEQISAAYLNASASFKKLELMAGLRLERTVSDGISPTTGQELKRTYSEFFPSLFVTHKISEKHTMNYSVSRRINRPPYETLNPFLFYLDQFTYKAGNPFLQPEFTWNSEIGYSYNNFLFVNGSYSRTLESMTDVSRQIDSTGIIYQTTVNLNKLEMAYIGVSVSNTITKWWINETNVSLTYARYQSDLFGSSFDNRKTSLNAYANETFILPKGWKIQLSGWYQSAMYYGFFYFSPMGAMDASISRSFFKNKLQCSLNASDILHTQTLGIISKYDTQDILVNHIPDSRAVVLRMRYNFGNAKAARKTQFQSGADELKNRAG